MMREKMKSMVALEDAVKISNVICISGPTGSGKSTILGYLVSPEDNKRLSNNIGEKNQKSLFKFKLSLNEMMEINKVYIKAKVKATRTDYSRNIIPILASLLYNLIDNEEDLELLEIDDENVLQMFNPKNKQYRAFNYLKEEYSDKIEVLIDNLRMLSSLIWNGLKEECEREFKKRKDKKIRGLKKKDVFLEEIENRLYNNIEKTDLENWFKGFDMSILNYYKKFFNNSENIIYEDVTDKKIADFMSDIFDDNSVFSLVFSEVIYITRPSDEFLEFYNKGYRTSEKPFVINILDTMGITHISDEKSSIENEIDGVLANSFDSLLFICKSDEKDTVYEDCIEVLSKKNILNGKAVTVCRTKADIIIKSKANNSYKKNTGKNEIPEIEASEYYKSAFESYKLEYLCLDNNKDLKIGNNKYNMNNTVEFISLAPNDTKELKIALGKELDEEKIFRIILNLNKAIEKQYSENGILIAVKRNRNEEGIALKVLFENISKLSDNLVNYNEIHKNGQYLKYINGDFHGRSISNYYNKAKIGLGHETQSETRDNFRIFIANMIGAWLRKTDIFSGNELLFNIDLSNIIIENEEELNLRVKCYINNNRIFLLNDLAKKLSYDYMEKDFNDCYYACNWQVGFKKNLELLNNKFSDKNYWESSICNWINLKMATIINNIVYVK
ncbi:hypothetical protein [Clostridium perfringens]|uniref:hypothetical protein n=1 Tax=Clostridium perfringens TaxID=1502 RepID=UPI001ABA160A|nr:hypothetical protein [Clostridium perfringens]MBO3334067.1 hypothetical protein [Clostridium perfringens]